MLDALLTVAVVASHGLAMRPFVRALRAGRVPHPIDFTVLSAILYYDLGLVTDLITGQPASSPYFRHIGELDVPSRILAFAVMLSAPWLIRAGGLLAGIADTDERRPHASSGLSRAAFLCLALPLGAALSWWSLSYFSGRSVWETRANLGADIGLYVVLLYLPLHMLAFYIQRPESRGAVGSLVSVVLAGFAICASLPIGQRTNALLPILLLVVFWRKPSPRAIVTGAAILFVVSALLLPMYKWQFAGENAVPASELISSTFSSDLSRVPVLAEALNRSAMAGSDILPYPGAGYVYTTLFFVPRAMAPFKGYATAIEFTAAIVNQPAELVNWRFGVGVVEEGLLNGGVLFVPIVLAAFGALLALATRLSRRLVSLQVPLCLAAIWSFGYDSASLLLMFGTMTAVCGGLEAAMRMLSSSPLPSVVSFQPRTARHATAAATGRG